MFIGFYSTWTDDPKARGDTSAMSLNDDQPVRFDEPGLASFDSSVKRLPSSGRRTADGMTLVALDQAMTIPNADCQRPVQRVVAPTALGAPSQSFVTAGCHDTGGPLRNRIVTIDATADFNHRVIVGHRLRPMHDPRRAASGSTCTWTNF